MSDVTHVTTKHEKIFRIINISLMIAFSLASVAMCLYNYSIGDPDNRAFACIGMSILFLVPIFIELIFRCKFSNFVLLSFVIFTFLAGFLGCVFNFYEKSFLSLNVWYDIFIHSLAGYVFCLIGLILIAKFEKNKKLSPWTIVIFCFCFTLAIELVWELMEWFADCFLGQTAQGHPISGQNAPLVTDTDIDLLCNFTGGFIFAVQYIIGKFTKVKTGVKYLEKELCSDKVVVRKKKKAKQNIEVSIDLAKQPEDDQINENDDKKS